MDGDDHVLYMIRTLLYQEQGRRGRSGGDEVPGRGQPYRGGEHRGGDDQEKAAEASKLRRNRAARK